MTGREGLVPKRMTDKNGRETTVLVNPNKGTKSAGKPSQGAGWATGSPARVSARNRVESAPTPPKPFTALAGLEFTGTTIDDEHDVEWTWNSINRETGTKYDRNGRDQDGFDRAGFNRDGFHTSGFDIHGRDRKGRDQFGFLADGTHYGTKTKFDTDGFDVEGVHAETGTRLDPSGKSQRWYLDRSETETDPRQFLPDGTHEVTRTKFDTAGFDRDGYDVNGLDANGHPSVTIPEGQEAQWKEFFRRAAEGGKFPLDVYEEDGATVTHEWSLNRDGDGVVIHVKRELSTRWDSSAAMERLWESGMSYRGVGEDSFDSFVERSVEGINRNLLQYEFDASRVQHYDEPMLETDDVMEIMRGVGLDPDDPRVEMDADDIWGRIGFKYSVSAEGIDRDDFIAYLRDNNLYDGD